MISKSVMAAVFSAFALIPLTAHSQVATGQADGAILRGLDKVSGVVNDITLPVGTQVKLGFLTVKLSECRYPQNNPSGDAFAHLTIVQDGHSAPSFDGWMTASSPALNPLDHSRYDVWVLRCAIAATSSE